MKNDSLLLTGDERIALRLRELYSSRGYTQYKMNKFEEYDLYVRNKDFLTSDSVITFTDTNGKLLAMKPDVTLSIVKNASQQEGAARVYYQENVYRVSGRTHSFREIMQLGLECIGEVDEYCLFEVLTLAAASLAEISANTVLDISHVGVLLSVLDGLEVEPQVKNALFAAIGEKNAHEISRLCREAGIAEAQTALLCKMVNCYGAPAEVLPQLLPLLQLCVPKAVLAPFVQLLTALEGGEFGNMIRLDFSVTGDIGYYNGIVFKGFVSGIPTAVLSGGEYGGLLQKMGKVENAIGFAVYMDSLERFLVSDVPFDVDAVVLYGEGADPVRLQAAVSELVAKGESVTARRTLPRGLRYRKLYRFESEGKLVEADA